LGRLVSPSHGFWVNARTDPHPAGVALSIPGLKDSVTVVYDERQVPHIYARNAYDLYLAQGYLTARDRLFQMDLQTRSAGGQLAEVLGAGPNDLYLELDRFQRRIGMVWCAERAVEKLKSEPRTREAVEAYAAGVNAWIAQLRPQDLPVEYKLLNFQPSAWTPLRTALLLKLMAWDLTGHSYDLQLSYALARYGKSVVDDLFPNYRLLADPIIPVGTPWVVDSVQRPAAPGAFLADTAVLAGLLQQLSRTQWLARHEEPEAIGSNNWAVHGSRTRSGKPLLANDPHLGLQLPSLWYEVQLSLPGQSVYGVSLPGAPAVIIGHNDRVAWGVTNVDADVLDWYHIRFRDSRETAYRFDGQWEEATLRRETIAVKGRDTLYDTVRYTRHGPVVYSSRTAYPAALKGIRTVPQGYAIRWLAHETGNEMLTFLQLNEARGYADYRRALEHYDCPAQNFAFASVTDTVALWVNGKLPLKWKEQGKYLLDGESPTHEWKGWVPRRSNPHVVNPARGFISSANQASTDSTYPFWINWRFATWERGNRINDRLSQLNAATAEQMRELQNDNRNLLAVKTLPVMLGKLGAETDDSLATKIRTHLREWNLNSDAESVAASVFDLWWRKLADAIWADDFPSDKMLFPSNERTALLLTRDSTSRWYDDQRTTNRETLRLLVQKTFAATLDSLKRYAPYGERWQWGHYKGTQARHLLRLPALGSGPIFIGGGKAIVNATTPTNGPSWRMVVQLGSVPQAHVSYPGGQSGHPGDPDYIRFVDTWRKGNLYTAQWWPQPPQALDAQQRRWVLKPAR
jgi:penicillin amidase